MGYIFHVLSAVYMLTLDQILVFTFTSAITQISRRTRWFLTKCKQQDELASRVLLHSF